MRNRTAPRLRRMSSAALHGFATCANRPPSLRTAGVLVDPAGTARPGAGRARSPIRRPAVKFLTSTTSVSLPAAARVAQELPDCRREVFARADRNDPRVVNHLVGDGDITGPWTMRVLALYTVRKVTLGPRVMRADHSDISSGRRTGRCPGRALRRGQALPRLRRHRRNAAVRRIDDERRAARRFARFEPVRRRRRGRTDRAALAMSAFSTENSALSVASWASVCFRRCANSRR